MNNRSEELRRKESLYPYEYLVNAYKANQMKDIDTSWIGDVNAPTYLALFKFCDITQSSSNTYRLAVFKRVLRASKDLVDELEQELD